jgi:D-aspartate ligase
VISTARRPRTSRRSAGSPEPAPGGVVLGGDSQGLGIARSLGRHGIPVCVVDDETSISRASRYVRHVVRVPDLRSERGMLDALALAQARHGLRDWVLYPTRDENVAAIAANRETLQREFRVPTPALASIRSVWDKRETYRLAEQLGIPIPRTWFPRTEADLDQIDQNGPLVLKPAIKENFFYTTHVKAWRADTRTELTDAFRRAAAIVGDGEIIIQEMIPGGGEQQYAYCALFRGDGPVGSTRPTSAAPAPTSRRSTCRSWPSPRSGSCAPQATTAWLSWSSSTTRGMAATSCWT